MLKIIHLTDTHLVEPGRALYALDPGERLDRAIDSIAAEHGDAELCIVTGDLTHEGHPLAYARLARSLARLPMPVWPLLGNHDHRSRFLDHFPEMPVDANGFVQFTLGLGGRLGIALDTNEPGVSHGVFCARRAAWLDEHLAASGDRPVLLFMHHPPFPVGIPAMDRIALIDTAPFEAVLARHPGRIAHLFFGHLHRPICGSWRGIPYSTMRGTNHQVALDLAEPRRVAGSHEPPQYAVVLLGHDQVTVHLHDFDDGSPRFWL